MEITVIPHVNAVLNAFTIVLLWLARGYAKSGNEAQHKKAMVGALSLAVMFLVLYTTYHLNGGFAKFGGEGLIRWIYFPILIVHVIGAATIVPLVPLAVVFAVKDQRARHKKTVKWAWPLWFFVSVSGVVVYVMSLHLWPCEGACLLSGYNMPGS